MAAKLLPPRGIRNNNPGNIRRSADKWQGLAAEQPDKEFFVFQDMPYGIRAMARLLINYQDKKGLNSIAEIISTYAPAKENNTRAYVSHVAAYVADKLDGKIDSITKINTHDYDTLRALIEGMIQVENGGKWSDYITESQIVKGLLLAGVEAPKKPLNQSRTIQGQQVAAASLIADGLTQVNYIKDQLSALIPYSDYMKYGFLAMALIGIALTVYARIDDRRKGIS